MLPEPRTYPQTKGTDLFLNGVSNAIGWYWWSIDKFGKVTCGKLNVWGRFCYGFGLDAYSVHLLLRITEQ